MREPFSGPVRAPGVGVFLTKPVWISQNPKVIRSTMGSIYRMPFLYVEDVVSLEKKLKEKGNPQFCSSSEGREFL